MRPGARVYARFILLRLDEDALAQALALAATFTAGLQQAFRTEAMAKPLHAGRAG